MVENAVFYKLTKGNEELFFRNENEAFALVKQGWNMHQCTFSDGDTISRRLREWLDNQPKSMQEIANDLGIKRPQLSVWALGKITPKGKNLKMIEKLIEE